MVLRDVSMGWVKSMSIYLQGDAAGRGLAGDQALPSLSTLTDNFHGVAITEWLVSHVGEVHWNN